MKDKETQSRQRFQSIGFEDFKSLAKDPTLSPYEKIGFPDSYRAGKEELIFHDIAAKLTALGGRGKTVLDVGPGCSELPAMIIELCRRQGHTLLLVDSDEMLRHLPDAPFIRKYSGRFPGEVTPLFDEFTGKVDVILTYSVLHYIFAEQNIYEFLDRSLALMAAGGQYLIGDIPNESKRRRFFSSTAGVRFHQDFTGTTESPTVVFNTLVEGKIDDAVLLGLMLRARSAGFDAYIMPHGPDLPMANRREDLLIVRP